MTPSNSQKTGRPRSEERNEAILSTAWKQLQTSKVSDLSIEGIARESGIAKTTIYRRWPNKAALVVDAFIANAQPRVEFKKSSSAKQMLTKQVKSLVELLSDRPGRIIREIIAEGIADEDALTQFKDRFLAKRREVAHQIISDAIESGEFSENLDPTLAMDMLYGPIYYRLLVAHEPLTKSFAKKLTDTVIESFTKN